MRLIALVLLALATSVTPVVATYTYKNGFVYDGYTYNDGYWWLGSQAHTRQLYQKSGYWYCGTYYPSTQYYEYSKYDYKYSSPKVDYKTPGWRDRLLEIAAARDRVEGRIRKEAHEQQYFLQGVQALGLSGNFRWEGYGTVPPYALAAPSYMPYATSSGVINFGANANTSYGVSYSSLAQVYGDNNTAQLYQMANQHVLGAQKLAGDGQASFSGLLGQEGGNRARVATILAKGQVLTQLSAALDSGSEVKGISFKFSSGGKIQKVDDGTVDPTVRKDLSSQFAALVTSRCAGCHSAANKKGGFDVAVYPTMSDEQKQAVWATLVNPDDRAVMPKPTAGEAVKRLSPKELRLFFLN